MLTIEINSQDCGVESRNVQTKSGPQTFYHQTAYLHRPGVAYPDRFRLPVRSPAEAYAPGRYTLGDGSYRVGRYGDLEINRFEMTLHPVPAAASGERKAS